MVLSFVHILWLANGISGLCNRNTSTLQLARSAASTCIVTRTRLLMGNIVGDSRN